MSNVIIDRQKIDILANAISTKSGVPLTMTLDEMVEAVDGIQAGGNATLITKSITVNGTYNASSDNADGYSQVTVTVPAGGNYPTFTLDVSQEQPAVTCDKTYAECRALINQNNFAAVVDVPSADTVHSGQATFYQAGYPYITYEFYRPQDGLPYASVIYYEDRIEYYTKASDSLPSSTQLDHYGTQKGTINRSTSVQYLNIPVGAVLEEKYYTISATPDGTAGTPTATKGTVSNHSVSVTPSVTNTTGYITGSTKTGTAVTVTASELASGNKAITQNGTGIDVVGYSTVSVDVQGGSTLQSKSYNVSSAGTETITADSGYDGLSEVEVSVPSLLVSSGGVDLTYHTISGQRKCQAAPWILVYGGYTAEGRIENGYETYNAIPSNTSITPTESSQTIGGANYMMEGAVTVNAIPSNYVGSGITQRSSTDLTVSGATVTTPAGYYSAAASKSVATMTLPTAAASSATSGYTSKATIGRSTAAQYINIPPGYNSTGVYYVISATPNGSVTAPSSISGTAASVSTGTNTLTLTKTVSVTPNVTTAGYISSGTAGNSSVSLTASVTTKAAATITPTTTNQTIAAGTYLTGTQTIAGDADLVASNIVSGVQIFGVTGNVVLQNYYTGSSAPSSSTGSNGDLYLQT